MAKKRKSSRRSQTSWDPLADWYEGWVGKGGSKHHRKLAIPAVLELLEPRNGENILDLGAGQGVLAPHIAKEKASYTGVDVSEKLLRYAQHHHGNLGQFIQGDVTRLKSVLEIEPESFDAVVFLLSIQDMDPLLDVIENAAWALKPDGRLVILLTHPCFRVPRQSGWGWDEDRKLRYRRIDRYLSSLSVPLKPHPGQKGVSRSFHRPLHAYINGLALFEMLVDQMVEIPTYKKKTSGAQAQAENLSNQEIPLFLGLRARKLSKESSAD